MTHLEIEFEERLVPFADAGSWEKFRAFSPTGLVPCLIDHDVTVWESLAIIEYLAERHPEIWPQDPRARAWARSAAAEMHAGFGAIRNRCPMTVGLTIELKEFHTDLTQDLTRLVELWTQGLSQFAGPFLAGSRFTAVDAFFAPVVFRANTYQLPLDEPTQDYADCILNLPSMQRWYGKACAETWREASHEEEIRDLGRWVEDRRSPEYKPVAIGRMT
jgi:glutathione S-transferase